MLNLEKLIQSCNYLLKKNDFTLNYTKLIKLLYLADKESLKGSLQTITGDTYVSMDNGPVLSSLYDLIRDKHVKKELQTLWNSHFLKNKYDLKTLVISQKPHDELSAYEMHILDSVYEQFKSYDVWDMVNYVHKNCPEWEFPEGSSIPIHQKEILQSIGRTQEEIELILAETDAFEEEEQVFSSLAL